MARVRNRRRKGEPYFARSEITSGSDLSPDEQQRLQAAIDECDSSARDQVWQYASWQVRATAALMPAYKLYLVLEELGDPAVDDLLRHSFFTDSRRRKLGRKKTALMAVQFTLRPRTKAQRKTCSAWSPIIESFAKKGIQPDGFQAEVGRTTLRNCTDIGRAARRRERENAAESESAGSDEADEDESGGISDAALNDPVDSGREATKSTGCSGGMTRSMSPQAGGYLLRVSIISDGQVLNKADRAVSESEAQAIASVVEGAEHRQLGPNLLTSIAKVLHQFRHGHNGECSFPEARRGAR